MDKILYFVHFFTTGDPLTQKQTPLIKKPLFILSFLLVVFAGVIVISVGGLVFAANQESHDSFCASCHSQPESTFYQRATGAQPTDMASFHTNQSTHCIDCHSGTGLTGRMQAEFLGASNALKWYTGKAVQPAIPKVPISDQNCLKCHQAVTQKGFTPKEQITMPGNGSRGGDSGGRNNHWHQLLAQWQAASPTAGTCATCHSGHGMGGTAQNGFMTDQTVQAQCDACHQVLRHEGGG